jgi:ABC-2 type transport system permease protein
LLVLQIDEDFERRLLAGRSADVQVIADGRNSNTAGIALGYIANIIEAFNAQVRSPWSVVRSSKADLQRTTDHGLRTTGVPSVSAVVRAWYNPNLETRWHMIPSLIGTLTLLEALLMTAMSVAREREQGTFDQLLVTPYRPVEIMAGKALPSVLTGLGQATTVLLVAQLWFHIPFAGSFLTLYAGLAVFLFAAVGIGLLLSSLVGTMQQAMLFAFLVVMPFVLLSGLTTPLSSMPEWLQYFTLANPLRYAIEIAQKVYLEGAGLGRLIPQIWPLAVIAVVTLAIASWMFRHRLA